MLLYIIIAIFILVSVLLISVKRARFILSLVCLSIGAYFTLDVLMTKIPIAEDYKAQRIEYQSCSHDPSSDSITLQTADRSYLLQGILISKRMKPANAAPIICKNREASLWMRETAYGSTVVRGIDTIGFHVPISIGVKLDDPYSNLFWGLFFLGNGFFIFIFTMILGKELVSYIMPRRN